MQVLCPMSRSQASHGTGAAGPTRQRYSPQSRCEFRSKREGEPGLVRLAVEGFFTFAAWVYILLSRRLSASLCLSVCRVHTSRRSAATGYFSEFLRGVYVLLSSGISAGYELTRWDLL